MRVASLLPVLFAIVVTPAIAGASVKLVSPSGGTVFVWKNSEAHGKAIRLIDAGVHKTNPALILPYLACMVSSGTQAVITSGGMITQDVQVIEGAEAGCEGNVASEFVKTSP